MFLRYARDVVKESEESCDTISKYLTMCLIVSQMVVKSCCCLIDETVLSEMAIVSALLLSCG